VHKRSFYAVLLAAALLAPSTALAGEFIPTDSANWYRFTDTTTGQTVESRIVNTYGTNWNMWSNLGGLGNVWVYTTDTHEWWWVFNGRTAELMPTLEAPVGYSRTASPTSLNSGAMTIGARGLSLTTPAGTFTDVTRIDLQTAPGVADAGVSSIYFARGIGVVKWTENSFIGPRDYVLSTAQVAGQSYPARAPRVPATPTPTAGGQNIMRAPSEHAPMEFILWGCADTYLVTDTYADAWPALAGRCNVQSAVDSNYTASQVRYEMGQAGVSLGHVEFLIVNLQTVWMRDYGPIILKNAATGERMVGDPDYYYNRPVDNAFPEAYALYRGWRRIEMNLGFEGGNFATDGQGQAIISTGVRRFNPGVSLSSIQREFDKLGCDRVEWLEPLVDEGTTHVDMFMRIMTDDTALVSRYPSSHRQARVCDAAAAQLQALGYRVTRVDADYRYDEFGTYSNSVLANGVALIPQYTDATKNRAARAAYQALGYDAYGVDSTLIIRYSGATHCVSMQIPR
jgi:agmatine/peptidylarginine deiminase